MESRSAVEVVPGHDRRSYGSEGYLAEGFRTRSRPRQDAGGSRTHWTRLCRPPPRRVTSASSSQCPRQESNLVYDLRSVACVHHTPRTIKYPTEESNLARLLRRQSCVLHTRRAFLHTGLPRSAFLLAIARRSPLLPLPGIEPGPGPSESPMQIRYTIGKQGCPPAE
jgi:hypothetical protein